MKKFLPILQSCPLFAHLAEHSLFATLSCLNATVLDFPKKSAVFSEGDAATQIGIVLSGSVTVHQIDFWGNRSIIGRIPTGGIFGETFACSGAAQYPVDVVANEATSILLLEANRILHPCERACSFHRQLIDNLVHIMAQKNLAFQKKIQITSQRTTREKLLTYLWMQAKEHGNLKFTIPFNRQELADYLDVDRSGLSSEISKLRSENFFICERNYFELNDRGAYHV